ncbi:MAG: homoserine kinase [Acidimicrobiia bacterium]|nr:homoserine kinase [Acidimicrobiia bacterium]
MTSVTAFAPATVSNVACGFDVLGFPLQAPGDEVTATFGADGVRIADILNDGGRLPRDASRNTAGVAVQALLSRLGERRGMTLTIRKGLPLSSGLGGSAASAAAAVVAVNALVGAHAALDVLVEAALEGERLGAGSAHADNIAPCLCGGLVLVRRASPPDIIRLPVPDGLTAVVVHPNLEIETAKARELLGDTVSLRDAVRQWANLGTFVDGLHRGDFAQIARSLEDTIAEPRRAPLVPGLAQIKGAAADAGALGCSLSGSGPSLFALCQTPTVARVVAEAMTTAVKTHIGGDPRVYVSPIAAQGAHVTSSCGS